MSTELQGRELDVEVHRRVFGIETVGWGAAMRPEGDWSVHLAAGEESTICSRQPLFVEHCICDIRDDGETGFDIDKGIRLQGHSSGCLDVVPFYHCDPAAMMKVVEELQKRPYPLKMERWPKMDEWQVASGEAYGIARTLPEAVCRAALAAVKGGGK